MTTSPPAHRPAASPSNDGLQRRLRAVAMIDVVGYSRLMASEEARTHARVNRLFAEVVKPEIDLHGGRQIERAGDGLLVLFESSTAAVRCALAVQSRAEAHEHEAETDRRLRLRVGINVGDIIIDGEEIAGDDVNIAARLQALAEPGTVCISDAVRSQLHEELDSTFEDLGHVSLKNIGRPIRVFQLRRRDPRASAARARLGNRWRWLWRRRPALLVLVAGLAATLALSLGWTLRQGALDEAPPPMSVAVLPFKSRSPLGARATEGEIADTVTRGLTLTEWIRVVTTNGMRRGASEPMTLQEMRSALKVRYAVRGFVEVQDDRLKVSAELTDTSTGVTFWNGGSMSGGPDAGPNDAALSLVVQLRDAIYEAEAKRLFDTGAPARTPMEHKMLGDRERQMFPTLERERAARAHYEDALKVDPNFVPAVVALAYMLISELDLDPAAPQARLLEEVDGLSKRAVSRQPGSAPAWQLRSEVLARQWLWEAALDASDRALALDPGRAYGQGQRASLLVRLGRPMEALKFADKALALAEQRSGYALFQRCRALMALGEHMSAVEACQKSLSREDWWLLRAHLLAAYALTGQTAKAEAERSRLMTQEPRFSIARVRGLRQSNVAEFNHQFEAHFLRGLRLAGIPEEP